VEDCQQLVEAEGRFSTLRRNDRRLRAGGEAGQVGLCDAELLSAPFDVFANFEWAQKVNDRLHYGIQFAFPLVFSPKSK
jgi:hypothetical protein